jgi:transcriptional regulator with PAS, ATPase and Fis domain
MLVDNEFRALIKPMADALEASLDPVCVVDRQNHIVYLNAPMRSLLKATARSLAKTRKFCDLLKLAACEKSCRILHAIESGEKFRMDEAPAASAGGKMRVLIQAVPIRAEGGVAGAVITVRDTTGEILLQAKYHKSARIIEDLETQVKDLNEKYREMQERLRRAAMVRISK